MRNRNWSKALPARTIRKDAPENIIFQILDEEDLERIKFLTPGLRKYYSEQDFPFILEAITEERKKARNKRSVLIVYQFYKSKLVKRKQESKQKKNIKKRAKKIEGEVKRFKK